MYSGRGKTYYLLRLNILFVFTSVSFLAKVRLGYNKSRDNILKRTIVNILII